ncbi:MAG: hypothetical protein LBQ96_02700 [Fusobacteriaceae bacterium]|jgi:hypothetical protein|nr:hypothetical protein [Fusobacteriaceae bacterium]
MRVFYLILLFLCLTPVSRVTGARGPSQKEQNAVARMFAPKDEREVSGVIYNAILRRERECDLSRFRLPQTIFFAHYDPLKLVESNPALQYVARYRCAIQNGIVIKVSFEYKPVPVSYNAQLTQAAEKGVKTILKRLRSDYTPEELVCAISDYIAINCRYAYLRDGKTPDMKAGNAYAALVGHRAVCDGYAGAFMLLAQLFGLEVRKVTGVTQPGNVTHAWNLVKVDGKWYHVDVAWNDPSPDKAGYAGHAYLLLSDNAIGSWRGAKEIHASWRKDIPKADSRKYDDAFWRYERRPISFTKMRFQDYEDKIARTSFEDVIREAVKKKGEANVERFGYRKDQLTEKMRQLYPKIGFRYETNEDGVVLSLGRWEGI